jgi:hypothetical protein
MTTKLYELPRNTYFRLVGDTAIPPGAPECPLGDVYLLKHIDGMYSYCKDSEGNVVHIAAWSEVEKVES